jgi:zinc transport system ATP-binding protein
MAVILSVKDLTVVLDGRSILEGISFELERGSNLAIIGPNGSGKTVLLRCLLGMIPYSGVIRWAPGVKRGYVPQRIELDRQLPLTIGDLLRAKCRLMRLPLAELQSVQEVVGLTPEIIGSPVGSLSGGQFQKSLISFALLGGPDLLLLDEPTASLDQLAEERVYELMQRLQQKLGLSLIVVSHDVSMVYRYANNVLCLNRQGLCFGPPRQVLTPEALQALYGEHLHLYEHQHGP